MNLSFPVSGNDYWMEQIPVAGHCGSGRRGSAQGIEKKASKHSTAAAAGVVVHCGEMVVGLTEQRRHGVAAVIGG